MDNLYIDRLPGNFTVTAHTGPMGTPDNSIESILTGIGSGADIIEFDLHIKNDAELCLSHNPPEDREVVMLPEALAVVAKDSKVRINIDIKQTKKLDVLEKTLAEYGLAERAFLTGVEERFLDDVLRQCRVLSYYLNVGISEENAENDEVIEAIVKKTKDCGAIGINICHDNLRQKLVDAAHAAGLLVSAWTANSEDVMVRLINLGVDNITTRKPDELIKMINEAKKN